MKMKHIGIVIVNWNAGYQLKNCVDSLLKYGLELIDKIIIVDNNSSDNSAKHLENHPVIQIINLDNNMGFAKACNIGAKYISSKYILFLNPDTMIFEDTLYGVLKFLEEPDHSDIGICGVKMLDENNKNARSCANFPSIGTFLYTASGLSKLFPKIFPNHFMVDFDHTYNRIVPQVIGAFYFIKNDLFIKIGGYDERFFVYYEDLDLALRVKNEGYNSYYLADYAIYHKGGGVSSKVKAHRLFYSLRSRIIYAFKHFSSSEAMIVLFFTYFVEFFTRLIFESLKLSLPDISNTIKGFFMLWKNLPNTIKVIKKNAS